MNPSFSVTSLGSVPDLVTNPDYRVRSFFFCWCWESDRYWSAMDKKMAWHYVGAKPLFEPMRKCHWIMFAYNDWSGTGDNELTRWGPETHICVSKLTTINSDNGLSPGRRQTIIWANAGILLIGPMGTNFSEIVIKIYAFSLKKMHCKMLSGKWWPYCLSLNVLSHLFCTQSFFLYIHIDVRTNWPILQLFSITFSRKLFPRVLLTMSQYLFRWGLHVK